MNLIKIAAARSPGVTQGFAAFMVALLPSRIVARCPAGAGLGSRFLRAAVQR